MRSSIGALIAALCLLVCAPGVSRAEEPLPVQVTRIFQAKCAECHSPTPSNAQLAKKARKKWSDWSDLVELKSKHVGSERDADQTDLWETLIDKDSPMPPQEAKAGALTAMELATIKRWIEAGAPSAAQSGPRALISDAQLLRMIHNDLLSDDVPEAKRPTTRYFTLANLYNNPNESAERLDLYRQGFFKLVNSLSWQNRIVLPAEVKDSFGTVWRINLRDLGWSEELWEELVAAYPYFIDYGTDVANSVATLTSSRVPVLRADWFVFAASQPPLYHDFLELGGKPDGALAALEKRLNVDRIGDIQSGNAARAAIQAGVSGVSRNNRLVERHDGAIGGYYWLSYDFSSNLDEQDLPGHPLGPPEAFQGNLVFRHAGGEVIFALPNHMQGYLLVKSDGSRLDTAPTNIVIDPESPGARGGEIVNGISCISCHAQGMRDKVTDEVRARADADQGHYSKHDLDLILALYRPKAEMDELLAQDKAQFRQALTKAHCATTSPEPVRALFDRFSKSNVDATAAAAELGLSLEDFTRRLTANGLQGLLEEFNGTGVPRDKFIDKFQQIVAGLSLGTPRPRTPSAASAGDDFSPPNLGAGTTEVELPAAVDEVSVGGSGRYLFLHLKKLQQLAVFDVSEAKIVKLIPLPSSDVTFAAGARKLFIGLKDLRQIQRWDLAQWKLELTVAAPEGGIGAIAIGCTATTPIVMIGDNSKKFWLVNPLTLKAQPFPSKNWGTQGSAWGPTRIHVSFDGSTAVACGGGWAGIELSNIVGGRVTNVVAGAYVNGDTLVAGNGALVFPNDGGILRSDLAAKVSGIDGEPFPADDPAFSLAFRKDRRKPSLVIFSNSDPHPLITLTDLPELAKASKLPVWQRIHLIPRAKTLVTVGEGADELLLRKFDIAEELDAEGIDYLFVESAPISTAERGSAYAYDVKVRSKRGNPTFDLQSGPPGMTISPTGELRWSVPPRFNEATATVIIQISDASGQSVFHSFAINVTDRVTRR